MRKSLDRMGRRSERIEIVHVICPVARVAVQGEKQGSLNRSRGGCSQREIHGLKLPGDTINRRGLPTSPVPGGGFAVVQEGLQQADGKKDLELAHNSGDDGDPFPGSANNSTFDNTTNPGSTSYAGIPTSVSILISPVGVFTVDIHPAPLVSTFVTSEFK